MDYLLLEMGSSGRSALLDALEVVDEGIQAVLTQWDDLEDYRRRVLIRRLESRSPADVVNLDEARPWHQLPRTEVRD